MEGKVFSVERFIGDEIPKIIDKCGRFRVVMTTYNEISGYSDGKVSTGDPNLQIKVLSGGLGVATISFMMDWAHALDSDSSRAGQIYRAQKAKAETAQKAVTDELSGERSPNLILMYGGLRGFDLMKEKCAEIRQRFPKAYIAILACDCDSDTKARAFKALTAAGNLNAAIMSPACGGRREESS